MQEELAWLQEWYRRQCNGQWELARGIRLDTLDKPGWSVEIDLYGTALENRTLAMVSRQDSETEWIRCWTADGQFRAFGGPRDLGRIVRVFREWVETETSVSGLA